MSDYSFVVSPGFATNDNVTILNNDIDTLILDNTRLSTLNRGLSIGLTFDTPLSEESIKILIGIFNNRDVKFTRAKQILVITPKATIKASSFKLIGTIPFHNSWKISNIEVVSSGLTNYVVQIYDTKFSQIIAEKQLNNTEIGLTDLGKIKNLPFSDSIFEINAKTIGSKSLSAYIDSIIITYN